MSFERELEEAQAYLKGSRVIERRKAVEKITVLLNNGKVIPYINDDNPFSWNELLEDSQSNLKKECDRVAETISKKGPLKTPDKNVDLAVDFLVLIVKKAIREGEDKINVPMLIKYIDGCLREKKMKACRDNFLRLIKEHILPNSSCLGYFEPEDFILLFTLLKSELARSSTSESNSVVVFNCFLLLIKHGPLSALPPSFLREQFGFISKLCQSVTQNSPRIQQEDAVEIVLAFCEHTAKDNRLSCIKLGEEIFATFLNLYGLSGHDSNLKVNFVKFCLLQMIIHNPNGSLEGDSQALASNWHNWKTCVKKIYSLITLEINQYLRQCVKNTLFFVPHEKSTVILDSFVLLFVEVCRQLFNETESPMNYSLLDNLDISTQTQKRRKVEATLESFVAEIQDTKSWVWVKLVGALLERYPELINKRLFLNLLQILHTLQLEVKDSNTMSYIYETQAILIDIESRLESGYESEIVSLWNLVGDSTLRAVGLNQNIKETLNLLQKLISRNFVNVESVIQTYTSGVLIITKHHLNTLELVLQHTDFSQLGLPNREELLNSLLSSQNVKDYSCFLNESFAEILVALTLKQCPSWGKITEEPAANSYEALVELYVKINFNPKHFVKNKLVSTDQSLSTKRTFNVDFETAQILIDKLRTFVETSQTEPLDRLLCIIGLLYNTLSSMVNYQVIQETQINESELMLLIKQVMANEPFHLLQKYQTHSEKTLKELLKVTKILDVIFSIKNNVTSVVKEAFTMNFFRELINILNYFQDVAKSKLMLEHVIKKALTKALSKYFLVSNSPTPTQRQCQIMLLFANPDYDFRDWTDYDLIKSFLENIKLADSGFLPTEAFKNMLECVRGLCSARFRNYQNVVEILPILKGIYRHLKHLDDDACKTTAVKLLQLFHERLEYYGPDVAVAILDGIEELCKADPNFAYSTWDGKEVIKYVPQYLASDFLKVRYRAIDVLVNFLKISLGATRLETIHRIEELLELIYESNIKVFEVEGSLTDERRRDEILCRASSALYTFLSIIVNCNSWIEESLFAIIKLEHNKGLYNISNGELIEKVMQALQNHFGSEDFMKQYVENILSKWINLGYDINKFQYRILGCSDKIDLYIKYFDLCLPLLLRRDRNDLFAAAKQLKMTEKDVLEHCCTKIFGRALSSDMTNMGDRFIEKNVEVSYLAQVLGSRFKENLIENIDQVVLSLVGAVTDERAIEQILGETILFTSKGITYNDFERCLEYIQNLLCNGRTLIDFLSDGRTNKLQAIILDLELKVYSASPDQRLKCFHQYTIFVSLILETMRHDWLFFLRDTIYFLVHLTKNSLGDEKLSRAVLRYLLSFLKNILPEKSGEFEQFLIFTVNSLKNVAIDHDDLSPTCIEIFEFLIINNADTLLPTIKKLDAFPSTPNFNKIKKVHNDIKYGNKEVSLEYKIKSFLEYSDITTRQDGLIHLKSTLSKEKEQLKQLYEDLYKSRGFSEDCEQSLLHKLTSMLIKMSCDPNDNISHEALNCLGELGPADLTTIVLEPEKRVLNIKCTPFELLTGNVVSLLTQYIVDADIDVVRTASAALYEILKFEEGHKVVNSHVDFGYGPINKDFIKPYIDNVKKSVSRVQIDLEVLAEIADNPELWCPSEVVENKEWITSLVLALLNSFDNGCYLKNLVHVCKVKVKFCENILPLLIYLMLSLSSGAVTKMLSARINEFFSKHWNLTVSSSTDKNLIAVNKKSVKSMLDVINFIRQQPSISQKLGNLKLSYLSIAKSAAFCSAHFSALLYAELWCQEMIELERPRDGTPFENGYTLLDYIYESVSEEIGITLQQILQSAYKSIGDLDALSGCGISLLLRPDRRVEYYKNTGQWGHVMNYYSMHPISGFESNQTSLIQSFKMNQLYQLPLFCENLSEEPQYECLWRLCQWNTNKKENFKCNEINPENYEKYKFNSLKALCDNDRYSFTASKNQLSACLINNLKHTSLESSKNVYPIFSQIQSLNEMDDCLNAVENGGLAELLDKWKKQDAIIRKNDFQFVEPIVAQRMTILSEFTRKDSNLKNAYFKVVLDFADYAKEECQIRVAENAIINVRKVPNLESTIENELLFRDAQLAWLNGDKLIAQQLLRKLCKVENLSHRLKAGCLKLQGEYNEMYSDRTSILNSFYESVNVYNEIPKHHLTADDYKSMEDTYDKIATFADREYQQIMNHINSDLFQKKLSNIKSCKEMAKAMNVQKKKSEDEKKAQIIHERQIRIDENEINTTLKDKEFVLGRALKFYIKNLSACDSNNIKIFRVMALFLENKENRALTELLKDMVTTIPSYKYITMLPQLIPHISMSLSDLFGQQINKIIEKCAVDHPHHTLSLLLALVNANKDKEYTNPKAKTSVSDRTQTAIILIKKLQKKNEELRGIIDKMLRLSEALIELAYYADPYQTNKTEVSIPSKLKIHKIKDFEDVLVPTYTLPTVGGINAPKRIECRCTFGKSHSQLVKGQDDLRQDAVMQQVFTIMTDLLSSNKQTKSLLIRTYKIVPLSMRSGILEWVANSMPIGDYLAGSKNMDYIGAHREFRPQDKTPADCRNKFKNCKEKPNDEKLAIYKSICKTFQPVFHKFFETQFRQPSVWYERKRAYIHSVATTSMCGYILGIGDRHVSNILIDKRTAEVIHIDFGIAFEQGKCLPTPETVPFRLTRDVVDGMGVSGIEGLFRKSCEKTMEVLRSNSQTILTILEVLLYDPLYFWTVSAAEANKRQTEEDIYGSLSEESDEENKNISAQRALLRLRGKLQGTEEGKSTSIEQQVGTLIQKAMDPTNLCRLFVGWQPYL